MKNIPKQGIKSTAENQSIFFTPIQYNIFEGLMLGDAGIVSKMFIVSQKKDREEYLYYLCKLLDIPSERVKDKPPKIDERTGKTYYGSYLRTLGDYFFEKEYERWYKNGIKIIPRDIKMSKELLLNMFLCDGSGFETQTGRKIIKFATNCFKADDLLFFISLLKSVGINAYINGELIYIPPSHHRIFFNYIGECPVECFRYKWIYGNYLNSQLSLFNIKEMTS